MNSFLRTFAAMATALFLLPGMAPAKAQLTPKPDSSIPAIAPDPLATPQADPSPATAYTGIEFPAPSAIATPPPTPAPRKPTYNSCQVPGSHIAITFDDGPHPKHTPRLLDMLKERGVKATFYVIGQNVVLYPEIVQRMVAEGHEIGNHSYTHPSLTKISSARLTEEISKSTEVIEQATGVRPTTMRPPYGAINPSITKRLNEEFDLPVILWSVDPQDWKIRKASHVSNHILQNTTPGAIVLAHDIHPSTIDAMPAALDGLLAKGFKFVTVSELISLDGMPAPAATPAVPAPAPAMPTPSDSPAPAPRAL
jgi:peptidoglycan/xylan/chitin deacetylase (PgdA/CDA1 family)